MMCHLLIALLTVSASLAASPSDPAVPLFFIANHGQAPPEVQFMAQGSGLTAYFSPGEALFRVREQSVHMQLVGARPSADVEGLEPLAGEANFLTGEPGQWRVGVPLYRAVAYRQLYPGIDMLYGANGRDFKSEFVVAPGADPTEIRLRYGSDGKVHIDELGELIIPLNGRELLELAPTIYQDRAGSRVPVAGQFALAADGTVSFAIGEYDPSLPLILDPVLSYSTLLGGSSSDAATALAVDSTGAAYIAGFTASYDFPAANPEQNFNAGGNDAFVAKLNPSGNGLVYCTYLGGRGDDRAYGIAVDAAGSAYVTGSTTSTNFPARNSIQATLKGAKN
ncbi:MAG: SBBP repeat-containing protein, partial [Acidobacteriia bacterium]|nr:SBBP repeat-containing protein [Terriglobia bacterium]